MKIILGPRSLILFLFFNLTQLLFGQGTEIEQETVYGRLKNPISTQLKSDTTNIDLYVNNSSFYPYIVEIEFREFQNLSPRVFNKKVTVLPGPNKVFSFKIVNRYEQPVLSYSTRYYMAPSNIGTERFNPYLVPVGKNKTVLLSENNQESHRLYTDQFKMKAGDTVFCSRKGVVTALPDNVNEVDRIVKNSFEIRHDDGTIAVYVGIDPSRLLVKLGQKVFPSQPVGMSDNKGILVFRVYEILSDAKIQPFEIYFPGPDNQLLSSYNINKTVVVYPESVIKKEMSKREASKYGKDNLF
jgi:hypothetical protein